MKTFRLTPAAEDDLFQIWTRIAAADLTAADKLENEILCSCQRVAERSDLGHFRRDLTDRPVRFLAVHRTYLLVYDPAPEPLPILRILHGARDVAAELGESS
jgi:plasmid stabilization system protein ParE